MVVEIVCIVPTWGLWLSGSAGHVTCCAYFLDYFRCHIFYLGLFGVKNILKKITLDRTALTLKKSAAADVRMRVNIQWLLNSARPLNTLLCVVATAHRSDLLVLHCISLMFRGECFKRGALCCCNSTQRRFIAFVELLGDCDPLDHEWFFVVRSYINYMISWHNNL